MTPEDLDQIRSVVREEIGAEHVRWMQRMDELAATLEEHIRDMQTEILNGVHLMGEIDSPDTR